MIKHRIRIEAWLAAVAISVVLAGCAGTDPADEDATGGDGGGEQGELDEVTFALAWLPVAEAAAWYSAWDQGWFEEEGIDVEILRGYGSSDTAQRVATGEADFGVADAAALVPLRVNEDLPVMAFAAYYAEPPQAIIFRADDDIEEPAELEGRTVACSAGNAIIQMFPAFAHATGIDQDSIQWQLSDPGAYNAVFAGGQTDATCEFIGSLPVVEGLTDDPLEYFLFADYGVTAYSHMLVASETTIAERPELVERFTRAALRGLEFAVDHPEEAIDILLSHESDLDPDITREAWSLILDHELITSPETEQHGLGYISPERMQATFDTLVEAGGLEPGEETADDLYTTDFLP